MAVAFLDEKEKEIADRIKELEPSALEYDQLLTAAGALGMNVTDARATPRKRGPGRPPGKPGPKPAAAKRSAAKAARKTSGRRAGRRKGSGTRAAEALQFVTENPGITIPELAAKMGIKQNYLYRVLPGLEREKKAKREGKGWHPIAKASAAK